MENILKRDITGECIGACRNTVREAEERRQREMGKIRVDSPESYPSVSGAYDRNEAPGFLGGHV